MASAATLSSGTLAANGGSLAQDVDTASTDLLTVIGDLGPGAVAAADVQVKIIPYLADTPSDHGNGRTLADAGLAIVQDVNDPGVAAYLAGGHARVLVRVRTHGVDRIQVQLTNKNATVALAGRIDVFTQ